MNQQSDTLEAIIGALDRLKSGKNGIRRVSIGVGDTTIEVEWDKPRAAGDTLSYTSAELLPEAAPEIPDDAHHVCSPMLGTFYHAPEPGAAPFISVGDMVEVGQQVGILEAMKLMNRVDSDVSGRVTEICVPNGTHVEYGERLVVVTTDPPEE